jgi:phage putative head morphogenesis protein, SPP1 gp7 family
MASPGERGQRRRTRLRFGRAKRAEATFARRLIAAARYVGEIVDAFAPGGNLGPNLQMLMDALDRYSVSLLPWATAVSRRMIEEVAVKDEFAWHERGKEMGRALKREIAEAPTGIIMRELMAEQVALIQSLPQQAAQRVHNLAMEGITEGRRADELAREIAASGHVTVSRAKMIARTETSRTATNLMQARALHVGSEAYIWRTAEDSDVRPSHKAMNGKVVLWSQPPTLDNLTGHAGALPNCRCYPEPILPEDVD